MKQWRQRATGDEGDAARLVEEAEQFLTGRYLETAVATLPEVPAAIWLSVLAHGDATMLRHATRASDAGVLVRPDFDTWFRVLEHLARVVEELVESGMSLEHLQSEVLVPLELAVLLSPTGPVTFYRLASSLLDEIRDNAKSERA